MAVVINEFEVITEPQPAGKPGGVPPETASQPPTTGPTPHDIERVIRRQKERLARVRAH